MITINRAHGLYPQMDEILANSNEYHKYYNL